MYYPYFRGKQFELMAIRELASVMATAGFVPIIEPVRQSLGGLERALTAITNAGGRAIVIVNPVYGDHGGGDGASLLEFLERGYGDNDAVQGALLLRSDAASSTAVEQLAGDAVRFGAIVHAGYTDARAVADALGEARMHEMYHVFVEDQANMLYRRHFLGSTRVLVRDGFERKRNADYAPIDNFSDLHATYRDLGMDGYGDFLTVGDSYSEGGGPAYAVAIHLTYIDPAQDDAMFVQHFVSDTNDTPTDPAGKFAQALNKLMSVLDGGGSPFVKSSAIGELRQLHDSAHFPGLGYVKKLSVKHHVETLAEYHGREGNA